jgi:hypothetical protein
MPPDLKTSLKMEVLMSRLISFLAMVTTAWALATAPALAQGVNPQRCGGRIVTQPDVPLQPGCRRGTCQLYYKPAQDDKGVYCIRVFACSVYCPKSKASPATAQQLFDNWNPGVCSVTDVAMLTIERPVRLQRIDIWYNWRPNETAAHYTASLGGDVIAEGELVRAECASNQAAWCVARVEFGADIKPGTYTYRTERSAICQNSGSGGQGFIRAYGANK